jgi:hypothetical protein
MSDNRYFGIFICVAGGKLGRMGCFVVLFEIVSLRATCFLSVAAQFKLSKGVVVYGSRY